MIRAAGNITIVQNIPAPNSLLQGISQGILKKFHRTEGSYTSDALPEQERGGAARRAKDCNVQTNSLLQGIFENGIHAEARTTRRKMNQERIALRLSGLCVRSLFRRAEAWVQAQIPASGNF